MPAFLFHFFGHGIRQMIGSRAVNGFISKTTDTVELCFGKPVLQAFEVVFCFTGEADDEC